jgi:hypothetical protein
MKILGARICTDCGRKFNWFGIRRTGDSNDLRELITRSNDYSFATFTSASEEQYNVVARCTHCGTKNKFIYP